MDLSVFIARLFSVLHLAIGLGMLLNRQHYRALYTGILGSPPLLYFGGVIGLFFGFSIITVHNIWTEDWRSLVTLIGWIAFIKGITLLVWPKILVTHANFWMKNMQISALIVLGLGFLFGYFGFFLG